MSMSIIFYADFITIILFYLSKKTLPHLSDMFWFDCTLMKAFAKADKQLS